MQKSSGRKERTEWTGRTIQHVSLERINLDVRQYVRFEEKKALILGQNYRDGGRVDGDCHPRRQQKEFPWRTATPYGEYIK